MLSVFLLIVYANDMRLPIQNSHIIKVTDDTVILVDITTLKHHTSTQSTMPSRGARFEHHENKRDDP